MAATAVPQGTSTKAILSLITGLFFFFFPLSIVAVILGHLSLSEVRKSAGRLKGEGIAKAGLVLGYAGITAIPIFLILAAIAIPNFLRAWMAANEASAVGAVRTLVTAEVAYAGQQPNEGYTCSLPVLSQAGMISGGLASGQKSGYAVALSGCAPGLEGGAIAKYQVVAYPMNVNQTGMRAFCSDESTVIKVDSGGSARRCVENGAVLE